MIVSTFPAEAKRTAFVDTARDLFFDLGYAGTSMSAVAARVGGSKTTLWSYFPSKEALFAAVVDELIGRCGRTLDVPLDRDLPVRDALRRFGAGMMGVVMTPSVLALHRLIIGEAARFPELGALFDARGPGRATVRLTEWIDDAMAQGTIRAGDPARAARQFAAMCQSGVYQACLIGLRPRATADEIAADIEAAVTSFARGWCP